VRRRLGISWGIAVLALALAPTAGALRFTLRAPASGSIVIAEVKGKATGRKPVRLKLLNRRALGRTIVASATWRARRGSDFDGLVVLLNPRGGPAVPQRAAFGSRAIVAIRTQAIISGLAPLLRPTADNARGTARRSVCANNLGRFVLRVRQYHDNAPAGISASTFLRQACAVAMDETIPEAPQFWSRFGLPFCGFYVHRWGSAGNEFQFNGSCNRALEELDVQPPTALTAAACIRFSRSDCAVQPRNVAFTFLSPPPAPYAELSGARVRVTRQATLSNGWLGLAQPSSGNPFGFRFDPTPGRPRFAF